MYLFWCNTCECMFEINHYWGDIVYCNRCGSDDTELVV